MAANGGATGVAWDYFWPGQAGQARHRVRCDSSDTEIRQNLCSRLLRLIVDLERVVTLLVNGALQRAEAGLATRMRPRPGLNRLGVAWAQAQHCAIRPVAAVRDRSRQTRCSRLKLCVAG